MSGSSPADDDGTHKARRRVPMRGRKSQRRPLADGPFEVDFYTSFYSDMGDASPEVAEAHYRGVGHREGRYGAHQELLDSLTAQYGDLPSDFDEGAYLKRHPDVAERFCFPGAAAYHYLRFGRAEGRMSSPHGYDELQLTLMMNRVHDMPEVRVDRRSPPRVNVLVPAFDFSTMSAGFFGVFQVAKFIARAGYRVRLVMFDNFYWNLDEFRAKLQGYPDMEHLFDELEVEYIGERTKPLRVSPQDSCVATVWYSAYFAAKIMQATGSGQKFLYLIQDYETDFFAGSSLRALAEETYSFDYAALFSTQALQDSFLQNKPGNFGNARPPAHAFFNNACASTLPDRAEFVSAPTGSRSLAFYSRPQVNRNMFELGALALVRAVKADVFGDDWRFFGMGIGDLSIDLGSGRRLEQLPRLNLREYQALMSNFDIGLSLMASPHPSLLPFDLGGSGAIVVTNTYGVKTQRYFNGICRNVIARPPTLEGIVQGLRDAVHAADDRGKRHRNAINMTYPRSWEDTFDSSHERFVNRVFARVRI